MTGPACCRSILAMGDTATSQPERSQQAWAFGAQGEVAVVETVPGLRRRPIADARADARRLLEYMAHRGKTPLELLQDIACAPTHVLAKRGAMSRTAALELQVRVLLAMMDYAYPKQGVLGGDAGTLAGQIGAGAAAHFLAASQVPQHGVGQSPGPVRIVDGVATSEGTGQRAALPPIADD